MINIANHFRNSKTNLDLWFFYGFLLNFTLSVRKVLFYFPIQRTLNEYTGVYIYLSDIFLFLTISLWLFHLLSNNNIQLSSFELWISDVLCNLYISLPLLLVVWSFISLIWASNQALAFFRSIKLLEYYLLYFYVIIRIVPYLFHEMFHVEQNITKNVPRGTKYNQKCSTWNKL